MESSSDTDIHVSSSDDEQRVPGPAEPWEDENRPLYPGSRITLKQSIVSILTFAVITSLTRDQFGHLLDLINLHTPYDIKEFKTLYKFRQCLGNSELPIDRIHYCNNCNAILDSASEKCRKPGCANSKNSFFIRIPFLTQLKNMYSRPGFRDLLRYRYKRKKQHEENIEGLYDAMAYKELCLPGEFLSDPNNISLSWNTDGVSPFKSAGNKEIWPIYLFINELPPHVRYLPENVILAAIWYGEGKPNFNMFVGSLYDEFCALNKGYELESPDEDVPILVRGLLLWGTCDLPAKAYMLNMQQYNGRCGCPTCYQPGETVDSTWVYLNKPELQRLRTDGEARALANLAARTGKIQEGHKGWAELFNIVAEPIRTTNIDSLHGVFGVTKKVLKLLFFTDFAGSLRHYLQLSDERLTNVKTRIDTQRNPRPMSKFFTDWKGHEHMIMFFCYTLPLLGDLMKPEYLLHFKKFLSAMYVLFSKSISEEMIQAAQEALTEWEAEFEILYGESNKPLNVHQMKHLPVKVRDCGALWDMNCFFCENLNGQLNRLINNSNRPDLQIASKFSQLIFVRTKFQTELSKEKDKEVFDLCDKMLNRTRNLELIQIGEKMSRGKLVKPQIIPQVVDDLLRLNDLQGANVSLFSKLLLNGSLYIVQNQNREVQYDNSFAQYELNNNLSIGVLHYFAQISNCVCRRECACNKQYYGVLLKCDLLPIDTLYDAIPPFTFEVTGYNEMELIPIDSLKCVCFPSTIKDTGKSFVVVPPHIMQLT